MDHIIDNPSTKELLSFVQSEPTMHDLAREKELWVPPVCNGERSEGAT
jgi:hypothetical protein